VRRILRTALLLLVLVAQACQRDEVTAPHPLGPRAPVGGAFPTSGYLAFVTQPPQTVEGGAVLSPPVQVAVRDSRGNTMPDATNTVTLVLAPNPDGATLLGTTTMAAVNGIATFGDLRVDRPGSGYSLIATAAAVAGDTSASFVVHLIFSTVDVGDLHTCGVTTSGAAYCWGYNSDSQLGDGTATPSTSPVAVAGGLSFTTLSVGGSHTCGLTTNGAVYCWGENGGYELGDGTRVGRASPVPVSGELRFAAVSAGREHTCALTTHGVAYCWGYNAFGQLGDGTTTPRPTPVRVASRRRFRMVSAGWIHTCGVTLRGRAVCWGNNYYNQLGDGTPQGTGRRTPGGGAVIGMVGFATVSAATYHTCGITTGGTAYCWGTNFYGQLGDGTTTNRTTAVPVAGGLTFASISAGDFHTCGATTSGAVYCWGENTDGQLGDGTTTGHTSPVRAAGDLSFADVRAGYEHTCGRAASVAVYCWGANFGGQLGNGTTISSSAPMRVVQ